MTGDIVAGVCRIVIEQGKRGPEVHIVPECKHYQRNGKSEIVTSPDGALQIAAALIRAANEAM